MLQHRVTQVTLKVDQFRVKGDDDPRASDCPRCADALELVQPDPESPERLLGTCFDCGSWFLIDRPEGGSLVEIMELPPRGSLASPVLTTVWLEAFHDRSRQAGA